MEIKNTSIKINDFSLNNKPIDYFKVLGNYFEGSQSLEEKTISPDENGYISDELTQIITQRDNNKPETITINAGVGQGKSTFAISLIKHYLEIGYKIIIAPPFHSLIEKYYNEAISIENLDSANVLKMDEIETLQDSEIIPAIESKNVFILTTQFIFRKGGEDGKGQAKYKRVFNDSLIDYCRINNKKVVIVFDEIHKGIEDFNREKIFEYFKWDDIIIKQFFLSATYCTATVMAIKFLSRLTKTNNLIINSNRIKVPSKNASLSLLFVDSHYNSKVLFPLQYLKIAIIEPALKANQKVNMIIWSKELSKSIVSYWGEMFSQYTIEPNLCTTETGNKYDPKSKFNIGTSFTTGVNISDGLFVIILPPKDRLEGREHIGIFSEGAESIIQTVARMRGNGKIVIVLSKSDVHIDDLNYPYIGKLSNYSYFNHKTQEQHISLNGQHEILFNIYKKEKRNFKVDSIDFSEFSKINFPSFDEWVVSKSKGIYNMYYSFGKKLVPFILHASFNNQFENCTLKDIIIYDSTILLNSNRLVGELNDMYNSIHNTPFGSAIQTSVLFDNMIEKGDQVNDDLDVFNYLISHIKNKNIKLSMRNFENRYSQVKYSKDSIIRALLTLGYYYKKGIKVNLYSDKYYFNHQISASILFDNIELKKDVNNSTVGNLVLCYKELGRIKDEFQKMIEENEMKIYSLPELNNGYLSFYLKNYKSIEQIANYLYIKDRMISNKIYSFFRPTKEKASSVTQQSVLERFRDLFLNIDTTDKRISHGSGKVRYYNVISFVPTESEMNRIFNLLFPYKERIENVIDFNDLDYSSDNELDIELKPITNFP